MTLLWIALQFVAQISFAQECKCPTVKCGACEVQAGLDFYSEPCEGGRVRSCSKPRCRPTTVASLQCPVNKSEEQTARVPAKSFEKAADLEKVQIYAAVIENTQGSVSVFRDVDGVEKKFVDVQKGFKISAGDTLQTDSSARVKVEFLNGNKMTLGPATRLQITEHRHNPSLKEGSTILNLLTGKVRNTISPKNKYDPSRNPFEVRTPSAVAGVRGTDFGIEYNAAQKDLTEVSTVHGLVALKSLTTGEEHPVAREYRMGVQVEGSGAGRSSFFTMPQKMSETEISVWEDLVQFPEDAQKAKIDSAFGDSADRSVASVDTCHQPTADFNSCEWSCHGNPKKEKSCRTDIEGVSCVRRRCSAGGKWVQETALPKAFGTQCPATGSRIADCDY